MESGESTMADAGYKAPGIIDSQIRRSTDLWKVLRPMHIKFQNALHII